MDNFICKLWRDSRWDNNTSYGRDWMDYSSRKKVALQHHAKHLEIFGAHSSWIMYTTYPRISELLFFLERSHWLIKKETNTTLALMNYFFLRKIALVN